MTSVKIPLFIKDISELDINQQFILSVSRGILSNVLDILGSKNSLFDPNVTNEYGMNGLHIAAFCGFTEVLKSLLSSNLICLNALDNLTRHPIHVAMQMGNFGIARILYAEILKNAGMDLTTFPDFFCVEYLDTLGGIQDLSFVNKFTPKVSLEPLANRILTS
ncbi:MAG: ankyrin repeat domain-containing protein [Candidatus Jidaibacter sp.]|jgi:ankyrin repeat protein|nr:ankyrin repeat domain-containing protein [Candidatus Jidaibacter sp.]